MNTIIPWLEHLSVLMPPKNIALVGAGNGKGAWAQWLVHQPRKSRVTLIEAEPLQYAMLQRTFDLLGERAQHCEIRNTVVAAKPGTASFFVANSQQESGLLEPRLLLSLWPNLQTEEVRQLSAINLDTLLADPNEEVKQSNGQGHWLVIDCLPAGALLRASSKLDLVDVVIPRVLLGEMHAMPDGTSLEEVAEFLRQKGMVQIAVEATRHPGIGYALFVRDTRAALHAQVQKHHSEYQKILLNSEDQAKLLEESRAKTEQLAQAKLILEQQAQERALQLEQLGKARDEQAKLAQERQAQVEQLTQVKAAAEKQLQEKVQQLEQFHKGRDDIHTRTVNEEIDLLVKKNKKLENSQEKILSALYRLTSKIGKQEVFDRFSCGFADKNLLPLGRNLTSTSFLYDNREFTFMHFSGDYIPKVISEKSTFYETPFLEILSSIYIPETVIIDCGANIGNHSIFFSNVLNAEVIAFEPQPFNNSLLKANALINRCEDNISIINKGVGDSNSRVKLYMAREDNYGSFTADIDFIKIPKKENEDYESFEMDIVRLDDEVDHDNKKVSIIKIDVEGMELAVLKGSEKIIRNNLPAIAVECFTKNIFDEIKGFLEKYGYFVFLSENATPTFIFLAEGNSFHKKVIEIYFEKRSLSKFKNNKDFNLFS